MAAITRDSLLTLEGYARARAQFRSEVLEHKRTRTVSVGPNVTLVFEDELTMRYQVQEMLRAERIFEESGIQDELDAYNPLIPDGSNWKATMLIEYPDSEERRRMLAVLVGIEKRVWVRVQGYSPVYAIADEDLERTTGEKTASVHFLRFELGPDMVVQLRKGAELGIGIDHEHYGYTVGRVEEGTRLSLLRDLA
jgi:hypothetical protein